MTGRSSSMPIEPEARQRLADLMDERRQELDKLWQDVASDGDISLKALHAARSGDTSIRPATRRKIEKGLRWERMSVDRILDGEDPVPLPPELVVVGDGDATVHDFVDRILTDPIEKLIWGNPDLTEAERLEEIDDFRAMNARLAAELRGGKEGHGTALAVAST
jgi:hypothetical protein